jgi:hypothetical protein
LIVGASALGVLPLLVDRRGLVVLVGRCSAAVVVTASSGRPKRRRSFVRSFVPQDEIKHLFFNNSLCYS